MRSIYCGRSCVNSFFLSESWNTKYSEEIRMFAFCSWYCSRMTELVINILILTSTNATQLVEGQHGFLTEWYARCPTGLERYFHLRQHCTSCRQGLMNPSTFTHDNPQLRARLANNRSLIWTTPAVWYTVMCRTVFTTSHLHHLLKL